MEYSEVQFWKDSLNSLRRVIPIGTEPYEDRLTFDEKSRKLTTFVAIPSEGKRMIHFEEVYKQWKKDVIRSMHYFAALWYYFNRVATNEESSSLRYDLIDVFPDEPIIRMSELYGIISTARDRILKITKEKCSEEANFDDEDMNYLQMTNNHYRKEAEDCDDTGIELLKTIGYQGHQIDKQHFSTDPKEIDYWLGIHSKDLQRYNHEKNTGILILYRLRHAIDTILSKDREGFNGYHHPAIQQRLRINTFLSLAPTDTIKRYIF